MLGDCSARQDEWHKVEAGRTAGCISRSRCNNEKNLELAIKQSFLCFLK